MPEREFEIGGSEIWLGPKELKGGQPRALHGKVKERKMGIFENGVKKW